MYVAYFFHFHHISFCMQEGDHNVTVMARNELQEDIEYHLQFEIVGKVRGVRIDDFQIITSKEQRKEFEISFESIGAGTCILVDFKDGGIKTFGDKVYCEMWQPDVRYDPLFESLTTPQLLYYTY